MEQPLEQPQEQPHSPLFLFLIPFAIIAMTAAAISAAITIVAIMKITSRFYTLTLLAFVLSVSLSLYGLTSRYINAITMSKATAVPTPKPPPVKSEPI